jgi:hypothetical protein
MGWMFEHNTGSMKVKEYAQTLLNGWENDKAKVTVVDHSLRGQHLWVALERTIKEQNRSHRFIVLYLLEKHDGMWGYKDLDETMHPYFYDCPKRLLKSAPYDPEFDSHDGAKKWREIVMSK